MAINRCPPSSVAMTDIWGNTVSVTDPAGTMNFVFNIRNQVTSIDGPGSGNTITSDPRTVPKRETLTSS